MLFMNINAHMIATHVYAVIAAEDNEEGVIYYLCHSMEQKGKLDGPMVDGENIEYHIGSVVVSGTWLRRYKLNKSNLWLF